VLPRIAATSRLAGATVVSFWPTPASCITASPGLRLDLPTEKLRWLRACAISKLCAGLPSPRAGLPTDARGVVEQVLAGGSWRGPRCWPIGEKNLPLRGGAQRRLRRMQLGHRHWADASARVALLWVARSGVSSAAYGRLAAGQSAEATRLAGAPYRLQRPGACAAGAGRGLAGHRQPPGGRSQILLLKGVYAPGRAWFGRSGLRT